MTFSQIITLIDVLARFQLISEPLQYRLNFLWWILAFVLYAAVFFTVFLRFLGNQQSDCLHVLVICPLRGIWFSKRVNQATNSFAAGKVPLVHLNLRKGIVPLAPTHQAAYRQLFVCGLLLLSWDASGDAVAPGEGRVADKGNLA